MVLSNFYNQLYFKKTNLAILIFYLIYYFIKSWVDINLKLVYIFLCLNYFTVTILKNHFVNLNLLMNYLLILYFIKFTPIAFSIFKIIYNSYLINWF
jgi:hypothetical protein